MRLFFTVFCVMCLSAGCDTRNVGNQDDDGGPSGDGTVSGDGSAHGDGTVRPDGASPGPCTDDDECVAAIRTDNCCEVGYAELRRRVESDLCLEFWPYAWSNVPQECLDRWDPECAFIDCMPAPPQWRNAVCTRSGCVLAPECSRPSDCELAMNMTLCCPCPEAVPAGFADLHPCFVPHPQGGTVPQDCYPQACPAMPCPQCPSNAPPQCNQEQVCWNENPGW